jgi:hypothetical protein
MAGRIEIWTCVKLNAPMAGRMEVWTCVKLNAPMAGRWRYGHV